jgi:hypothetical protein
VLLLLLVRIILIVCVSARAQTLLETVAVYGD